MYIMLAIWFAIAFLLFFFRPRALRTDREQLGKPTNQVRIFIEINFTNLISYRVLHVKSHQAQNYNRSSMKHSIYFPTFLSSN
jgi:hypothetical protein